MKEFIYKRFNTFLIIFSILSLTSVTPYWRWSLLSIAFITWNLLNEKKRIKYSKILLTVTTFLIIYFQFIVLSLNKLSEKDLKEWNKTGYDSKWLGNSQESINVIERSIERYKYIYGTYPDALDDISEIEVGLICDLSYRIKLPDGQTDGVPFYYEKVDSLKFYLAGVGRDGIIKTDDDLLPQISKEQEEATGLVKYVVKRFTPEEIKREWGVFEMYRKTKQNDRFFEKIEKAVRGS